MSPKLKGNSNLPYILIGGTFVLYLIIKLAIPQVTIWVQANWVLTITILAIAVILTILGVILYFKNRSSASSVDKKAIAHNEVNSFAFTPWSREHFEQWLMAKTPYQFEEYIRNLLTKRGFQAIQTSYSHDHGIDVIASKTELGIRHDYIFQCKQYKDTHVSEPVLVQLFGNMNAGPSHRMGIIVSTSRLTNAAQEFAERHAITNWDIDFLYQQYLKEVASYDYDRQSNQSGDYV